MQKKVSKHILAILCSVQKICIIYYVIHNFRQEGQGEHATKLKKKTGKRNKVNCVLLIHVLKTGKEIKTCRKR